MIGKLLLSLLYWPVAYVTMIQTQAELTVQATGYVHAHADCVAYWCSWEATSIATRTVERGRVSCNVLLDCEVLR